MAAIAHGTMLNNGRTGGGEGRMDGGGGRSSGSLPVLRRLLYLWRYFLDTIRTHKQKPLTLGVEPIESRQRLILLLPVARPLAAAAASSSAARRLSDFNRRRTRCCLPQSHHIALGKLVL